MSETKKYIKIRGASEHNLKHIDLDIPRDEFVVITGLSGSGKSSLAFDTIYAEGQRRYMESLSSYARQFLGQMEKPNVEKIEGLSPTISIDQKSTNRNPRSTVGTVTEIYDYMKSLGLKYSIYLVVKEIGVNPDYLTWDQVRLMHDEGIVGFGAHTYTHPHIDAISNIDVEVEFKKADAIFEAELGYKPLDFCYPYGTYSEETNEYISSHLEYKRIYTSRLMYSYRQNGKIIFGRNGINGDEPFIVFVSKLKGYYNVWRKILG